MRVVVVVAAMLFCALVFAQGVIMMLKSVTNPIGMELIEIPAGKFTKMGGGKFIPDEGVGVAVTLTKSFGLGKYEVTQRQWKSVMGTEPWDERGPRPSVPGNVQADKDCPATYVDWEDATKFCKELTRFERKAWKLKADEEYRLPTEAEWEYACRAGTTTAFSFGDDEKQLGEYAWFDGNTFEAGEKYAHKVGLKKPNPWGLFDMHGNVWEWCSDGDSFTKLSDGPDQIGPNGSSDRLGRGGCWRSKPGSCRSANRDLDGVSSRSSFLGFRVARSQSVQ